MRDVSALGANPDQGSVVALAVEQERRRMAHELHDNVIQQLVLACMLIDQARLARPCDDLDRVRSLLDDSLAQLRSMVVVRTPASISGSAGASPIIAAYRATRRRCPMRSPMRCSWARGN
jgi:signal transduction histidine kinase